MYTETDILNLEISCKHDKNYLDRLRNLAPVLYNDHCDRPINIITSCINISQTPPYTNRNFTGAAAIMWHSQRYQYAIPISYPPCVKRFETSRCTLYTRLWYFESTRMDLLPDPQSCGLHMRREYRERFPRHRLQRKPPVSEPGTQRGTCVTHVSWCMSGSLTCGAAEKFPTHAQPAVLRISMCSPWRVSWNIGNGSPTFLCWYWICYSALCSMWPREYPLIAPCKYLPIGLCKTGDCETV